MPTTRRSLLKAFGALPLLIGAAPLSAPAQTAAISAGDTAVPPILFVHGNGDHAALWLTQIWRMESNGVPRARVAALNFTDPLARNDDGAPQPNRSSTEDQRRELGEAIAALKQRTGAAKVALVASSRGGNAVRSYIKAGGAGDVSHAVLCGTPNHGVYAWDTGLGNEFNGKGPFLSGLNQGDSEVTEGVAFLTLRSDGQDKYAQPDGRFVGKPGTPTGVTAEGPELRGASNLVLGALDHREVAFHPRAFREIYKFIAGREPSVIAITPEVAVQLSGLVTATPGGVPTNRPVEGARVEVYRVAPDSGERIGAALYDGRSRPDGRWGPVDTQSPWPLEFVLSQPGELTTHIYRSPFPRSSDVVHLRAAKPAAAPAGGAGAVVMLSRPRGYFGLPRDIVLLDGQQPTDIKSGVPTDSVSAVTIPAAEVGRAVAGLFNEERIVARAWPLSENRISVAELTG
ncbi:hydrolase [Rhodopseudomonas palustris]|uniref:Hydrolase n=1 Tax=Rhodopseudomonas palustris TaxID=1076 RepID=A0A418VLY7_RHOPL|nr:hydrolase [Rhodopseudomonas palustris]RJF77052.1 hydrolase [Rhodopseudomonas palustris]